jgi:hypothetical protein
MIENWDELIKQQERSGMKPTEFCRARGIDPSKFGYQRWRRKGAEKKERFVRVDTGAVTFVEIVGRDGVTVRAPLSAIKEVLEALDAARS